MVMIRSDEGYPKSDELLTRVEYFIRASPSEGGILIVGKDSQGKEYKPKIEPVVKDSYIFYALPSGINYKVSVSSNSEENHPAIHFPFQLDTRRWQPRIIGDTLETQNFDDEFYGKFDLTLMDESMQKIALDSEVERRFKEIAVWGPYELKGLIKNHFWGEMYCERTPSLERFLENYRG